MEEKDTLNAAMDEQGEAATAAASSLAQDAQPNPAAASPKEAAASGSEDEITLIDIIAILWRRKWMIIGITVMAMVAVVVYSIVSLVLPPEESPYPNRYKPEAVMLIKEASSSGGSLSSALSSSGLAGLAGLAGVNVNTPTTNASLAQYLVTSNPLLDAVTDEFGLIEKFKIEKSPRGESRARLKGKLAAAIDDESGIFTVSFEDIDPEFAKSVVDFVVDWLEVRFTELGLDTNKIEKENLEKSIQTTYNEILRLEQELQNLGASVNFGGPAPFLPSVSLEVSKIQLDLKAQQEVYTQLKTEYELLKIQMQSEAPIFQILERPEVPDRKSGPSRGMLCIVVTFVAAFLSVLIAFCLYAFDAVRNDPVSWGKLVGPKKEKNKKRQRKEA